ncbi:RNA-directed DNA polymerase, eukaryota, reverse transcriptase zinc-binding domain protein [Tanacetum coccineum]
MRELREDTFSRNKNEDAHDHVDRVLNIVCLFNILGVSQDAVLLRVFPITLTRSAKIWVDRLTPGAVNTWDLIKKAFIQRYCPETKTAKRLEDIHNFKQESDKSLYQAWERYNDLLYKCPAHDINSHQKGPIPSMTPTQALTAIQTMVDHSHKWHEGTSSRNISRNSNTDGLAATVSKLDNLGHDMKKLKENVYAIQVKYGEFGRSAPFNGSNGAKFRVGASVNVMPRNTFEYLRLANLRNTNMLVEMVDMTKKVPLGIVKGPLSKSFYDYKWVFDLKIDQLADEYELGIRKKGHMLDKIWEYCKDVHRDNTYWWHNYGFEKDECDEIGIEIEKYDPLEVHVKTFKVMKYSFKGGQKFVCVTKEVDDALPLGRNNGSRFKEMIHKEFGINTQDKT